MALAIIVLLCVAARLAVEGGGAATVGGVPGELFWKASSADSCFTGVHASRSKPLVLKLGVKV